MGESKGFDKGSSERGIAVLLKEVLKGYEFREKHELNCIGLCLVIYNDISISFNLDELNRYIIYVKSNLPKRNENYPYYWSKRDWDGRINWLKEHIKLNS